MNVRRVALGDIAEFINGVVFKPDDWGKTGLRIIRIQNLTDSSKPYNRTSRVMAAKYHAIPGDLLVSWSASLGVFIWSDPDTALVNQHIFRVVPNQSLVDRNYLRHMMADALIEIERHLHGATMKHVNRSGAPSLAWFVRTLVGMDHAAAQRAFTGFLSDRSLTPPQIRFVEMVIDQLTARGVMEASALYEPPFSNLHAGGPDALFDGKEKVIEDIFDTLDSVHSGLATRRA